MKLWQLFNGDWRGVLTANPQLWYTSVGDDHPPEQFLNPPSSFNSDDSLVADTTALVTTPELTWLTASPSELLDL